MSAPVVAYLVVFLSALAVGERDLRGLTAFERRRTDRAAIVAAYSAIRDYVGAQGVRKLLLRVDDDRWGDAAGILLRLKQDEIPVAVQDGSLTMFTDAFAATGDEDAVVTLANLQLHQELRADSNTVALVETGPRFVDAVRITPSRVR